MFTAALDAAIGVRHIYERDPATGQWARVTDPDAIAALLNQSHQDDPQHRIVLYTREPDTRLLDGLHTFVLGGPFDPALHPWPVETADVDVARAELTLRLNEAFLAEVRRPRIRSGHAPASPGTESNSHTDPCGDPRPALVWTRRSGVVSIDTA
jgi:hypothetical protein